MVEYLQGKAVQTVSHMQKFKDTQFMLERATVITYPFHKLVLYCIYNSTCIYITGWQPPATRLLLLYAFNFHAFTSFLDFAFFKLAVLNIHEEIFTDVQCCIIQCHCWLYTRPSLLPDVL